jgi:hypothetical protein
MQCVLPAVVNSDEVILGLKNFNTGNGYSILLTYPDTYTLYYGSGAQETGSYSAGSMVSIFMDGTFVYFYLNGTVINAPLAVAQSNQHSFVYIHEHPILPNG